MGARRRRERKRRRDTGASVCAARAQRERSESTITRERESARESESARARVSMNNDGTVTTRGERRGGGAALPGRAQSIAALSHRTHVHSWSSVRFIVVLFENWLCLAVVCEAKSEVGALSDAEAPTLSCGNGPDAKTLLWYCP